MAYEGIMGWMTSNALASVESQSTALLLSYIQSEPTWICTKDFLFKRQELWLTELWVHIVLFVTSWDIG